MTIIPPPPHSSSPFVEGFEGHRVDRLDLQRLHEALRLGVVVWVALRPIEPFKPLAPSVSR